MNKHTTTFVVNSKTADCMGRIFPKILNQIVSDAASEHTIELGVDRLTLNKEGLTWMLHSVHFSIEQTPHVDDVLQVTTYPSGLDRLFALRCYEINNSDGKPMIKISSRWMQIDLSKRRPVRPTPAIVQLNDGLSLSPDMPQGLLNAKNMPTNLTEVRQFCATFDHIDFNGHVTQAAYMMWLTNSLSYSFHTSHELAEAEVVYQHEIMPESTIRALIATTENADGTTTIYHKLISESADTEHCIARTVWRKR